MKQATVAERHTRGAVATVRQDTKFNRAFGVFNAVVLENDYQRAPHSSVSTVLPTHLLLNYMEYRLIATSGVYLDARRFLPM